MGEELAQGVHDAGATAVADDIVTDDNVGHGIFPIQGAQAVEGCKQIGSGEIPTHRMSPGMGWFIATFLECDDTLPGRRRPGLLQRMHDQLAQAEYGGLAHMDPLGCGQ